MPTNEIMSHPCWVAKGLAATVWDFARDDDMFVVASHRCRNIIKVETAGRGRGNLLSF